MVHLLEDCNLCTIHRGCITIRKLCLCTHIHDKLHCCAFLKHRIMRWLCSSAPAEPKDLQLARRIRGPVNGVSSY